MMSSEVYGLLGLAARSRKISSGDIAMSDLRSNSAKLMILADDIGNNSKKKLLNKCEYYHIPFVYMDADVMNHAIGTSNRKFIAILDEGFAQKLHACLKG